jgi:hypothetical protein
MDLGVGTSKWDKFVKAIAIRNRITHPKTAEEMTIKDEEISICKDISRWFNDVVYSFLQGVLAASAATTKHAGNGEMPEVVESKAEPGAAPDPARDIGSGSS